MSNKYELRLDACQGDPRVLAVRVSINSWRKKLDDESGITAQEVVKRKTDQLIQIAAQGLLSDGGGLYSLRGPEE